MSLSHFLHEYTEHPFLGPYYDHWLVDSNYGSFGHIWRPDWNSFNPTVPRAPPIEWHEDETLYTVQIEIPGVRKEDITMYVTEDGRSLNIEGKAEKFGGAHGMGLGSGETRESGRPKVTKVRKTMADGEFAFLFSFGSVCTKLVLVILAGTTVIISRLEKKHSIGSTVKFSRSVTLPGYVDGKRVGAKLENGILTVTIPKLASPKHRRIVID
jgi:HSP20 family molecular chaperone IbpA